MSTLPTLESITSLYLYGSETPPDNLASDSIIRPPLKEEEMKLLIAILIHIIIFQEK